MEMIIFKIGKDAENFRLTGGDVIIDVKASFYRFFFLKLCFLNIFFIFHVDKHHILLEKDAQYKVRPM